MRIGSACDRAERDGEASSRAPKAGAAAPTHLRKPSKAAITRFPVTIFSAAGAGAGHEADALLYHNNLEGERGHREAAAASPATICPRPGRRAVRPRKRTREVGRPRENSPKVSKTVYEKVHECEPDVKAASLAWMSFNRRLARTRGDAMGIGLIQIVSGRRSRCGRTGLWLFRRVRRGGLAGRRGVPGRFRPGTCTTRSAMPSAAPSPMPSHGRSRPSLERHSGPRRRADLFQAP